ncbi:TRAP transporter small permease [Salsuginibacillus kocurii]|uniref:TRAP transporter small permease n=1 Tax=Salsuginibacillus kocurii TaxID=427078 RepID=UPI0003644D75|nr:TRAP transporter small permease [Salsuginibacillus kocurii]
MVSVLKTYKRVVGWLNYIVGFTIAILLFAMTVLIFWQVFARFVMGSPLRFSEEFARFAMVWLTMLGAAYAYRKGSLISVDLIQEIAGPKLTKVFNIIAFTLSAAFAGVLVVFGVEMTQNVSGQSGPSTGISMAWPNLAIPLAGVMILLNSVALVIDQFIDGEGENE